MTIFDNYAERIAATGTSLATMKVTRMANQILTDFENSPSYKQICITGLDGVCDTKKIQTTKKDQIIIHPDESIVSGSIVSNLKDYSWIITKLDKRGDLFYLADLMRFNQIFKWMNGSTIVTTNALVTPVSISDKSVQEEEFYDISIFLVKVLVQATVTNLNLTKDKRILIDGIPFKIMRVDPFTFEGCLYLIAMEDQLGINDINEVCDYIAPTTAPTGKYISGTSSVRKGLKQKYMLLDGATTLTATWAIEGSPSYAELISTPGGVYVQVSNSIADIGKVLTLQATYSAVVYTKEIIIVSLI